MKFSKLVMCAEDAAKLPATTELVHVKDMTDDGQHGDNACDWCPVEKRCGELYMNDGNLSVVPCVVAAKNLGMGEEAIDFYLVDVVEYTKWRLTGGK